MDSAAAPSAGVPSTARRWKPLGAIERRVLGVLVEKAKTTPDQYPLSLNALRSGCNQKSNRAPEMNLDEEQVSDAVDRLRSLGAVAEVQGGGRVPRYRHYAKDWLGCDGSELAVVTELLLRGAQTIGELRGRAARMDPIADVAALAPLLAALQEKELLVELTPPGRGQVVTHNLYQPQELERLRVRHAGDGSASELGDDPAETASDRPPRATSATLIEQLQADIASLRTDLEQLREDVGQIRQRLAERTTGEA